MRQEKHQRLVGLICLRFHCTSIVLLWGQLINSYFVLYRSQNGMIQAVIHPEPL